MDVNNYILGDLEELTFDGKVYTKFNIKIN